MSSTGSSFFVEHAKGRFSLNITDILVSKIVRCGKLFQKVLQTRFWCIIEGYTYVG